SHHRNDTMSIMQSIPGLGTGVFGRNLSDLSEPAKADPALPPTPVADHQGDRAPPFELPYTPHAPGDFPDTPRGAEAPDQPKYTDADLYDSQDPYHPEASRAPNQDDIDQDAIGDCYFVATLSAMAQSADGRAQIENAIQYDAGTGTFTVTLYSKDADGNPVPREITVTQEDIQDNIDRGGGSRADNDGGPIWPAVMEAAYAKMHYQDATANGQTADPRLDGGYGPGSADKLGPDGKPIQARND